MKVSTSSWIRGLFAILSVCCVASLATGQSAGDPGWFVRVIDTAGPVTNVAQMDNVLAQGEVLLLDDSIQEVLNFNGGGFPDDLPWPVPLGDSFVVRGIADVTIPAGDWGVGFGGDDGGQLHIPGVEFVTRFNTAGANQPADQIIFDGNRGYNTTWGSFSLDAPLETTINTSMWENGGGDNWDVFYINLNEQYGIAADELTDAATDTPSLDNFWGLLGVGDLSDTEIQGDWNVRYPVNVPGVALPVSPGQKINGAAQDVTKEEVGEVQPGLLHHWYGRANPGSYDAVSAFYAFGVGPIEEPDIAPFNPEWTWWAGNQAAIEGGTTDVPKYPAEIIDQARLDGTTFNATDNSNYTTALAGQLRVPRDGEYTFTDGVDDLTVLAIDVDRDGEYDPDTEYLINDNAWTSLNRSENAGGFPGEYKPVTFDVPEDGNCDDPAAASDLCWFDMEMVFGEGGGTDAGIIYWNENSELPFPSENGDDRTIADENIAELAIPEDHMRAPGGITITGANLAATLNGEYPYEFEINEDGTFDSLEVSRTISVATTSIDLNGATIDLVAVGDLSGLSGELKLLTADTLSGALAAINVPDGVTVDTSRLATEGIIVFGDGGGGDTCADLMASRLPGDADGDGEVAFLDFLALANNFGTDAGYEGGDFDCDGDVAFLDFLTLANNFGATAAASASAVPEPTSVALLGMGGLLLGLFRRRRD